MAAVTVTGSLSGAALSFLASYSSQAGIAASIFAATGLAGSAGGTLTSNNTVDLGAAGSILVGNSSFGTGPGAAAADIALGANGTQGQIYVTGTSADSVVTAADNSNSSVVNDNPLGNLVATTGAGGNVLLGLAGGNTFTTGPGGNDVVFLDGASNTLTTNGNDAVLVGGPSTITAAASGLDNVLMTASTQLNFINQSRAGVDSITGASGGVVVLAGTGATSIASGAGPESFFVDTSAGNTTLNGNGATGDSFTFVHDATVGTAAVTVAGDTASDTVNVHGYSGVQYTIGTNAAGSAVLSLTDGSSVTFTGVSAAALAAQTKPI